MPTTSTQKSDNRQLEAFKKMVDRHDLMYSYSDDFRVYQAGRDSWLDIATAAKALPEADVIAIWNAKIDTLFRDQAIRDKYYWEPTEKK